MSDPKYRIEAESIHELAAKMVYLLKQENTRSAALPRSPRIDILEFVCNDGSKVRISLSKKPADPRARQGVEIDGARLG